MSFEGLIKGLHHVTATVNDAQEDVDIYTKLLGQRLVKETVNFDNEKVYHFYYGNEIGSPSTIFTTFPYKDQGVRQGAIGTGQVYETVFSAPENSMEFWKMRLHDHGLKTTTENRFGKEFLLFEDPSGLKLSIVEDNSDDRKPVWATEEISKEQAIKGIHSVVLAVANADETIHFLNNFGYAVTAKNAPYTLLESQEKGAGNSLIVLEGQGLQEGINGLGTVHHVAHRVDSIEDSIKIKEELESNYGIQVTEVKDRKYFKSIYFRIPGNVLFEVATSGPGFLVDETNEELGTSLKLPDWQEVRRVEIEKNLIPYNR
ncbi:MAG: VOC family protein [Balneolaceae bacterium]|nr:VOC family protein [Balneolaceae bacterium]